MNNRNKRSNPDHELYKAILKLESVEECYVFFEDVCTINELLSLSQRYEVAEMLREKKTYLEIAEKTGFSLKGFIKLFSQAEGMPPLAWRRSRQMDMKMSEDLK